MAVIRSQGTDLYFINPLTNEAVLVGCPTSIEGVSAPVDQVEVSCLGDQARKYIKGMKTPGQASFGLQFDPTDPSHILLNDLYNSDESENIEWAIGLSDGTAAPTVDTAGEWLLPTTRTFITFEGYVADYPFTIGLNTVVTSTVSVQISGDRFITYKTTP